MSRPSRFLSVLTFVMASLFFAAGVHADELGAHTGVAWTGIRKDTFGQREILDGNDLLVLRAPERAEDAAVVPVSIRLTPEFANTVKSLTLIVDENPAPIVATFTYGEAAGSGGERIMATRIRVDRYTFVRVIAETRDGKLYMTRAFVKASGGCSAPASRDQEEAAKSLGKMRIKTATSSGKRSNLGEVMLRHPNVSGLAIDQLSGGYPPARFISQLTVTSGGKLVFSMEGGISISEDPHFRFTYAPNATDSLEVTAEDSEGTKFSGRSGNPS
jgi:sulfur-oxidizing protein SoxY